MIISILGFIFYVCRLLTVADGAWNLPTIQKFIPLLDNYERDTLVNEYVTPQVNLTKSRSFDTFYNGNLSRP